MNGKEQLAQSEHIKNLLKSEGWSIMRRQIVDRIVLLRDPIDIKDKTYEEIGRSYVQQVERINALIDEFRIIEGAANEHEFTKKMLGDVHETEKDLLLSYEQGDVSQD